MSRDIHVYSMRGHRYYLDTLLVRISKLHFLKDIANSFHQVTHIGLETHQIFFIFKVSQQIQTLEMSKVLAEMGRGWQAV